MTAVTPPEESGYADDDEPDAEHAAAPLPAQPTSSSSI